MKKYSLFFAIIDFLITHSKDVTILEDGIFILNDLGVRFSLFNGDFFRLTDYFRLKGLMQFFKSGDNVYVKFRELCFVIPFPSGIFELKETFLDDLYGYFDVKGKTVLDIGAFIGDTAIYFATKGARKVIAYEPVPFIYKMAKKNIKLNKFENIVQIVNEAVGVKEGFAEIYYSEKHPGGSSLYKSEESCKKIRVKVTSFKNIVDNLGHVDILKMDCEGAELEILPTAYMDDSLNKIDQMILEVHGGKIRQIVALLEKAGFRKHRKIISYSEQISMIAASKT